MSSIQGLKCRYTGLDDPLGLPAVLLCCCPEEIEYYEYRIYSALAECRNIAFFYEDPDDWVSATSLRLAMKEIQLIVVAVTEGFFNWNMNLMKRIVRVGASHGIPVLPVLMENVPEKQVQEYFKDIMHEDLFQLDDHEKINACLSRVLDDDKPAHLIREVFDTYVYQCLQKFEPEFLETLQPIMQDNHFYHQYLSWFRIQKEKNADLTYEDQKTERLLTTGAQRLLAATFTDLTEDDHERIRDIAVKDVKHEPTHTFLSGLAYLRGYGVKENRDEAIRRIRQASEEGLPQAGTTLSVL